MFKIKSSSTNLTVDLGKKISQALEDKDVVILEGDLGGGKTTIIKGVLLGLGYKKRVLSPTFTLLRRYDLKKLSVYHLDLYRLELSDLFNIGIDDFLYFDKTITLIEWGEKIEKDLDKYIKIVFKLIDQNTRIIRFSTKGYPKEKVAKIKECLTKCVY